MSVGAKLILFSTLLTIVAVSLAFLVLSVSLRRHTKHRLAETLARHGQTLTNLQRGNLDELLRISTLMTDSPTRVVMLSSLTSIWDCLSAGPLGCALPLGRMQAGYGL